MLGAAVFGSRTWICTIAAPAWAAAMPESAISRGVTGSAGFFSGEAAAPVRAQAIMTFRAMLGLPSARRVGWRIGHHDQHRGRAVAAVDDLTPLAGGEMA